MEIWKDIEGYNGQYKVSSKGKIMSLKYGKIRLLKGGLESGHLHLLLWINGISVSTSVHRLVAIHFIHNPDNLPCVLHKDETLDENGALYNGVNNLFWGTYKDNMQDMIKKGRNNGYFKFKFGKDNPKSKSVIQYGLDGTLIKIWLNIREVERELGIANSSISKCCKGMAKTAGGFIWKYS